MISASFFFFFNDTATTEIYTLSLHDALPILFTTSSRSGNSKRWGVSASRSFGPMSESVDMSENALSITSRNSSRERNSPMWRTLNERRAALHEVLVDPFLDRLAHALRELEHERSIVGRPGPERAGLDRLAELDPPP